MYVDVGERTVACARPIAKLIQRVQLEQVTVPHAQRLPSADAADFSRDAHATDPSSEATGAENVSTSFFLSPIAAGKFLNDSFDRCDEFCQKIIQIGAILAIFRPFAGMSDISFKWVRT